MAADIALKRFMPNNGNDLGNIKSGIVVNDLALKISHKTPSDQCMQDLTDFSSPH